MRLDGYGAGCLPPAGGRRELVLLAGYGAVSGLLYGLLLNLSFWPFARYLPAQIAFVAGGSIATNVVHWVRFDLTTSLGFDIPRAVGGAVLILLLGGPVLAALRRVARRAAFDAPSRARRAQPGGRSRSELGHDLEGHQLRGGLLLVHDERRGRGVQRFAARVEPSHRLAR